MGFEKFLKVAVLLDIIIACNRYTNCSDAKVFPSIDAQLAHLVCHSLNFHCELLIVPDGKFGRLEPDGNWSGLIGMIHRGEADLAVSTIGMTEERVKVVDFSYPFSYSEITFITRKPEYVLDIWTLIHPFSFEIWTMLMICFVTLPFLLYWIYNKKISFQKIAFDVVRPFFQQSSTIIIKKQSILMLSWIITMTFLSYCYTADLLSFLVFPAEKGVHNINELSSAVIKEGYLCVTYPGTYFPETLKASSDTARQIVGNNFNTFSYDIAGVLANPETPTAFIAPKTDFAFLRDLYFISNDVFVSMFSAIAIGKNFRYKDQLNKLINNINAAGLIDDMYEKEIFLRSLSYINFSHISFSSEFEQTLSLKSISSAFFFLFCGHIFACVVFLIELFAWHKTRVEIFA